MKVVCIDNSSENARHLEIGVVYDVHDFLAISATSIPGEDRYILNIFPYIIVDKSAFISLEEWREKQLKQIGL